MLQNFSAGRPAPTDTLIENTLPRLVSRISGKETKFFYSGVEALVQFNIWSVSAWFHYHSQGTYCVSGPVPWWTQQSGRNVMQILSQRSPPHTQCCYISFCLNVSLI